MKMSFAKLFATLSMVACAFMLSTIPSWADEGDELAICQGTGSGYGTRRTLTDSHSVGWVLSTSQSGYLGANNATNHNKVVPTAADLPVVKAVKSDATTSTTGYYFYYTTTSVSNVGSVEFSYTANSGNTSATAYVVVGDAVSANGGAAYETIELANNSSTAQGASLGTSGTFTYTFAETQTSARYYGFIIVTNSYKRLTGGTIKLYEGATGGSSLSDSNLTLTDAPVALEFDLYNNSDAQVVNYTTSSTGAVSIANNAYASFAIDQNNKTITVTPTAVTPSAQTITVNQAADESYKAGTATFTISIEDSTPFAGGDVTFDATKDTGTSPLSKEVVTFTCSNGVLNNGTEYRLYKNSTTTFETSQGVITDIVFTGVSGNPASGFADQTGWTTDGNDGAWAGKKTSVSFTASGAQVRATKIVVTVDVNGVEDPVISADDVDIDFDATGGSIAFTVTNIPNPAGTISASVPQNSWITLGNEATSPISFTCSANSSSEAREETVTLTYTYNTNDTVTKEVTVTQAGNPDVALDNIAALTAQPAGSYKVTLTDALVTYVNGSNAYLEDASGAVMLFGCASSLDAELAAGYKFNGTANVTTSIYNGLPEVTAISLAEGFTKTTENEVTPTTVTLATLIANYNSYLSRYVKIERATVTSAFSNKNCTITQDESSIILRDQNSSATLTSTANDVVTVTGHVAIYNATKQIALYTQSQIVVQPSITLSPSVANHAANIVEGSVTIAYKNLTIGDASDFAIQFYDENEDELQNAPAWIEAEVVEENSVYSVYYTMDVNEGGARSAYLKVFASGNEDFVYSNLVTITQTAPVVDYATLPFRWDNKSTPTGVTPSGVGTYTSSPYLKFDTTGDNIILKINEAPGALTFDIKGNPSNNVWSGSFTVLTSSNGIDYTELTSYTSFGENGNDQYSESFSNLASNIRYIKWEFTTKSTGNVALGNIVVTPIATTTNLTGTASNGRYWVTFYNGSTRYSLPDGAQAFTMNSSTHQLYLLGSDGKEIPAGKAVVIISDKASIELTESFATSSVTDYGSAGFLEGSDSAVSKSSITDAGKTPYVLGIVGGVLGFYEFTGTNIPAGKAYYAE